MMMVRSTVSLFVCLLVSIVQTSFVDAVAKQWNMTANDTTDIDQQNTLVEDYSSSGTFSFSQELLQITQKAVYLSSLAYDSDPMSSTHMFQYDTIQVFTDDIEQAILVSFEGYCMVAFRGTDTSSWRDIYQNLQTGNEPVCVNGVCCNAERGFYEGYHNNFQMNLENAVRECAAECTATATDSTTELLVCPTVVITGSSQGAAIASVAAMFLSDVTPVVITFGQPPTVDTPCALVDEERTFRFENSRVGRRGTTYDPVPYLPYSARHYGHQIMLGEDSTGVAYIGQSAEIEFEPWDSENFFATHRLTSENVGYIHRIDSLVNANRDVSFVRASGFIDGTVCSKSVECDSKICYNERCVRA
jgi:Lipase (class 3)